MIKKYYQTIGIILATVLSVGTILPLFNSGFFEFHDNTQVVRVYEMGRSLMSGMVPVRWVWELGYGYGYPIFNFYGPLPYYVGGSLGLLNIDPLLSTKIMFGLGIVLAAVSMYFLSKRFFGMWGGVVSAVSYAYFPYHAVNIYVRGAVGEFYAYAFLPLVFLGILMLIDEKKDKKNGTLSLLLTSIGIFSVATSHNLSIFMLSLLLVPFIAICLYYASNKRRFLLLSGVGISLGLMLSSFYIIPSFLEMNLTNVSSQVGGGANFRDHFVCIGQYWNSLWGYGGSVPGCLDGLSFKLGKVNILLYGISVALFITACIKRKIGIQGKIFVICIAMFVISLFLTLEISSFVWDAIPFISYIQYPWRFINFISLFMSLSFGYVCYVIAQKTNVKLTMFVVFIMVISLIFSNYKLFIPQRINNLPVSYYTEHEYIQFTVSKISDEYMPKSFKKPSSISDLPSARIELRNATGNIGLISSKPNYIKATFDVQNSGIAHANIAYFPAWQAYVNGKRNTIIPKNDGIETAIPNGNGVVEFKFVQTSTEKIANTISVVAFLLVFVSIVLQIKIKDGK